MNLRKIFTVFACSTASALAMAQFPLLTNYDTALFGQSELNGTARFVGVGGAMGALGGDATTIFYNPAGIGIYRTSEITASLNVHWTNTTMSDNNYTGPQERKVTANLANIAYIGHWDIGAATGKEKGLIGISFGAAYNRKKNFDRVGSYSTTKNYSKTQFYAYDAFGQESQYLTVRNFGNEAVGWRAITGYETFMFDEKTPGSNDYISYFDKLTGGSGNVQDRVSFSETGGTNMFAVSLAGNVSNIFYLGMSFECDYTRYQRSDNYSEQMPNGRTLNTTSYLYLAGTAFTYKVGFIISPTNWLRIGGAYHTPSYYYVNSQNYATANSNLDGKFGSVETPTNNQRAKIDAPMQAIASLGFVLGKFGFVGIDYQWSNESGTKLMNASGLAHNTINDITKQDVVDTHTVRVGFEIKPFDALSLRIGGGYRTAANKKDASRYYYTADTRTDTHYINDKGAYNITAGLGYRVGRHSLDIAYVWQVTNGDYYEFNTPELNVQPMNIRSVRNQIVFSYGVRF